MILVEIGAYAHINDPQMYSHVFDEVNEIENMLKKHGLDVIHYHIKDEEVSNCLKRWNYWNIILMLVSALFAVLLIPVDAIIRFVFKRKDLADKFARISCYPIKKIIYNKIISNLSDLKRHVKSIEDKGEQVVVIVY